MSMSVHARSRRSCAPWKNCRIMRSRSCRNCCRTTCSRFAMRSAGEGVAGYERRSHAAHRAAATEARSEHLVPLRFVLEHHFAEKTDGEHAVVEQFVVEFLERKVLTFLRLVISAQLQDLEFAQRVVEIADVESPAHRLGARRLFFVVTVLLEEFRGVVDGHSLGVHLDRDAKPAEPDHGSLRLDHAVFRSALDFVLRRFRAVSRAAETFVYD